MGILQCLCNEYYSFNVRRVLSSESFWLMTDVVTIEVESGTVDLTYCSTH